MYGGQRRKTGLARGKGVQQGYTKEKSVQRAQGESLLAFWKKPGNPTHVFK